MTEAVFSPARAALRDLLAAGFALAVVSACAARAPAEVAVTGQSASALPLVEPDHARLPKRLVWSDDFIKAQLDGGKWPRNGVYRFPGEPADTTLAAVNGETERYDPSMVSIDPEAPGVLHIGIEPDTGAPHIQWIKDVLTRAGKAPYMGSPLAKLAGTTDKAGMIHTYPNYVSSPGSLIELRVKLPIGCKGRWPAAWMFNYRYPGSSDPNAGLPPNQEDDIFEGNGRGTLKITMHNELTPLPQVTVSHPDGWLTVRQWRDRADGRIYEWIDDRLVAVLPAGALNELTLPLMLNIGGGSPSWAFIGMPDETTPRRCEMLVDYVRIYAGDQS